MSEPNGAAPQPTTTDPGAWTGALDDVARALVQTKGWKAPADVVTSYANLEKLVGHERVAIPRAGDDTGWQALYDRLGRPAKPDGYDFGDLDGAVVDQHLDRWARETFHGAGLSQGQAQALRGAYETLVAERAQALDAEAQARAVREERALELEWGSGYDAKIAAARKALVRFGGEAAAQVADALEAQSLMGRADIYRFLARIGEALGEDGLTGEGGGGFGLGPDQARAEIGRMTAEPETARALFDSRHPGHRAARERLDRLHEAAYG